MYKPISWKYLSLMLGLLLMYSCNSTKMMIDNSTVDKLDIDSYLGTWYEIARYPNSFEKDLVGVTATYSLKDNGKIKVVNQGYKNSLDGKRKESVGKAYVPDPANPAQLKVSFFWFFYGDYYVMELDEENYQWAVVGSSSPKYLWILNREPQMSPDLYKDLLERIKKRGYDLSILEKVEQRTE
jgi:apolipoprotein D and lipocalin family protein